MSNLISRKAIINEINEQQRKLIYCFGFENDAVKMMDIAKSIVTAMPSAQPEIISCKACMHNGSYDTDCPIDWNGKEYCSFGERITDE